MSASGELWITAFEQVADDYIRICQEFGEEDAETIVRQTLQSLGLDPHEIDDYISELKS